MTRYLGPVSNWSMRCIIVALLVSWTTTYCTAQSKPNSVCFDNVTGNRILDSLKSRAEWEKSYRILFTQYMLVKDHANDLDSTAVTVNAHCDSLVKQGYGRERELITDNTALTRQVQEERDSCKGAKTERWLWRIGAAVAIALTILSQ